MQRYLKSCLDRTVIVQSHGFAFRGRLVHARPDALELAGVHVLDESSRSPQWEPMDGRVFVPAPQVRFVQVV